MAAGAELTARGADDVSDRLRLVEQLRERARGIGAVIVERRRARRARPRASCSTPTSSPAWRATPPASPPSWPPSGLTRTALGPELIDLELAEEQFVGERKGVLSLFDPTPTASAASAIAEVRGELRSRRAAVERAETELARASRRADELVNRRGELAHRVVALQTDRTECEQVAGPLLAELDAADAAVAAAVGAHDDRIAERHRLAERAAGLASRVEALQLALDAAHARAGAERLAGVEGVLGTLLDLVRIDAGWESAVEAALGRGR